MAFPVEVNTMGGDTFHVIAGEDWSVWKFKCEVESVTGTRTSHQQLINAEGKEVQGDGPLMDFCCPCHDAAHITLVKRGKTQAELEWLDKWSKTTPAWLQKASRVVMSTQDLAAPLLQYSSGQMYRKPIRDDNPKHPTKSSKCRWGLRESNVTETGSQILTSAEKVLAVVRNCATWKGRRRLQSYAIDGHVVTLCWARFPGDLAASRRRNLTDSAASQVWERRATLEAVVAAVMQEPETMLGDPNSGDCLWQVDLVIEVLKRNPGTYYDLPLHLMQERDILYTAIELDPTIKEEFVRNADKKELRQWRDWQWERY